MFEINENYRSRLSKEEQNLVLLMMTAVEHMSLGEHKTLPATKDYRPEWQNRLLHQAAKASKNPTGEKQ